MKIIHSLPSFRLTDGGPPRSVGQVCEALAEKCGVNVGIVSGAGSEELSYIGDKVKFYSVPNQQSKLIERFRPTGFGEMLSSINIDGGGPIEVLHNHGIWLRSSLDVCAFAGKYKVPLVLSPRGMMEPWSMRHSFLKKRIAWYIYQQRALASVSAFHATADSEAESIRRLGLRQPIAVIPNGVVLPVLNQSSATSHQSSDKHTAFFLSRINPKKGLSMLLDAWKKSAPSNWRLVIAGNDDSNLTPQLKIKIKALGLIGQVELLGPLYGKDKDAAFQSADLFVLPSYSENFGIVVAEALSYGVPVLTTNTTPWQELEAYGCGWCVAPEESALIGALSCAMGKSNSELHRMGEQGRKLVVSHYQWPRIADQMLEFYAWLCGQEGKPNFVYE